MSYSSHTWPHFNQVDFYNYDCRLTIRRYSALQYEGCCTLKGISSSALFAVDFVVAVSVEQHQIAIPVVRHRVKSKEG